MAPPDLPPLPSSTTAGETIDLHELWARLVRGAPRTIGLALLGAALAAAGFFISGSFQTAHTTARVTLSFHGLERGEYPDQSKFQPEDLRAPSIVAEALRRRGVLDPDLQTRIRDALTISGLTPASSGKEPGAYTPREYSLTLSLPRAFSLSSRDRELFLTELVRTYKEHVQQHYTTLPAGIDWSFDSLAPSALSHETSMEREIARAGEFLERLARKHRTFRSARSNLGFGELAAQHRVLVETQFADLQALIEDEGINASPIALARLDREIRTLKRSEALAIEEEKFILSLLSRIESRPSSASPVNILLGAAAAGDPNATGAVLGADANHLLAQRALTAGLRTRQLQSQLALLHDQREAVVAASELSAEQRAVKLARLENVWSKFKVSYRRLIETVRQTYEDFEQQELADAARISVPPSTPGFYRGVGIAALLGLIVGGSLGVGAALLGVGTDRQRT